MARVPGTDVAVATLRGDCTRVAAINLVDGSQTTLVAAGSSGTGFEPDDALFAIAVDPQARFVYAVASALSEVKVIEWPSGSIVESIPFSGYQPRAVVFHPSRPLAYVTALQIGDSGLPTLDRPGAVYTIDTSSHTVIDQVSTHDSGFGVAISPDGSVVYVANANSDRVDALDTSTGLMRSSISVDNPVSVAFAPDQSVALASGHPVAIIDPATDTVIDTLPTERFAQDILIVEVPGGCVASPPICVGDCDGDGTVTVVDVIRALGVTFDPSALQSCESADIDGNRRVTVDELVSSVSHALSGCPAPSL
jgi:YVTN family beta-propeller protein